MDWSPWLQILVNLNLLLNSMMILSLLSTGEWIALGLLLLQLPAAGTVLRRLLSAPHRHPPLEPQPSDPEQAGVVSVLVPTLNEAERIEPCLAGLHQQGDELREVVVIDSRSTDDTVAKVVAMQEQDPRFRVITDDPLPPEWVGRPWALHTGFQQSSPDSTWILGIDADTEPQAGLIPSLLQTATTEGYDLLSLSPRFVSTGWGEVWLHPALLMTLIYRFGASGETELPPERVMGNGQCFLVRRTVLEQIDGYVGARRSFCDDVTLARQIAAQGFKVAFLDGSKLIWVRMYTSFLDTWEGWGRSLDLKDASSPAQLWGDWLLLLATQGLPLPLLITLLSLQAWTVESLLIWVLLGLNTSLVLVRWALLFGIVPSYVTPPWTFWVSPLADPLAVLRVGISALVQPRSWRGRSYQLFGKSQEEPV